MRIRVLLLLAAAGCASPEAGFWPQWRGPGRDNISRETGLYQTWPPGGPPLQWSVEGIGKGTSSVAVRDGRVFTLGYTGDQEAVTALDERTGRLLWSTVIGPAVQEHPVMRWFSPRTPTVDRDLLYAFRGDAKLICLRASDGAEVWRKDYVAEYGTVRQTFGHSDYTLVDGNLLICSPCGPKATVVALEKSTGREIWTRLVPGPAQQPFAAVVVTEAGAVRHLVAQSHSSIFGLRITDGELLWHLPGSRSGYTVESATPVLIGDRFVIASRWGLPLRMVLLTPGPGGITAQTVVSLQSPASFRDDSLVELGSHLYGVSNQGLFCLRADTGDSVWAERIGSDNHSFTVAEGRLYLYSSTTRISLIDPSPDGLRIVSSFFLPGPARLAGAANPVVTGGRLYLRDEDRLFCFDVRSPGPRGPARPPAPVVLERPAGATDALPRAVFVGTPGDVVRKMLDLAELRRNDVVYDLGSGDGRILIEAARRGHRAVGFEIDPELVELSERKIKEAGMTARVIVHPADLFTADLSKADVVAVYLPEEFLRRLIPRFATMQAGSRIVSHQFRIPGAEPDATVELKSEEDPHEHRIYLWKTPLRFAKD